MKVEVFHYDMSDRDLVLLLALDPQISDVVEAWREGRYSLAHVLNLDSDRTTHEILDLTFRLTQDTQDWRSTSVGDIVIFGRGQQAQAWVVDTVGFKPVTL